MFNIVNIELTNRCNKNCWMCGRRKQEKEDSQFKEHYNKDMDVGLFEMIVKQIPNDNLLIQLHNNGEPLMYPYLGEIFVLLNKYCRRNIRCLNTNGKLLLEKADVLINNLHTITISTFEKDPEWLEQYKIVKEFLRVKGKRSPSVIIRILGDVGKSRETLYNELNCLVARRMLHSPDGSFNYTKKTTIPEHGVCLEMLGHPAINVDGDMSICVRFDLGRKGVLGNLKTETMENLWKSKKRQDWLLSHIKGERNLVPLCSGCDFWGIAKG